MLPTLLQKSMCLVMCLAAYRYHVANSKSLQERFSQLLLVCPVCWSLPQHKPASTAYDAYNEREKLVFAYNPITDLSVPTEQQ